MKTILSLLTVVIMLSACNNTAKMKLRAPAPEVAETNTVKATDSLETDTTGTVGIKN